MRYSGLAVGQPRSAILAPPGIVDMSAEVDEPIEFAMYNQRWPRWYAEYAAEICRALNDRVRALNDVLTSSTDPIMQEQ
jgi:hypothetical protein